MVTPFLFVGLLAAAPSLSVAPAKLAAPREGETLTLKVTLTLPEGSPAEAMLLRVTTVDPEAWAAVRFIAAEAPLDPGGLVKQRFRRHFDFTQKTLPNYEIKPSPGTRQIEWPLLIERPDHFDEAVTLHFELRRDEGDDGVLTSATVVVSPPPVSPELALLRSRAVETGKRYAEKANEIWRLQMEIARLQVQLVPLALVFKRSQAHLRCVEKPSLCEIAPAEEAEEPAQPSQSSPAR